LRQTCAVLPFDARIGVSRQEADLLCERFTTELSRIGKYKIVATTKVKELLELQNFERICGAGDPECAVEAGRLLSVQRTIFGSVGRVGETYTINTFLVNVESSEMESTSTMDCRGSMEEFLTKTMAAGVWDLTQSSPALNITPARTSVLLTPGEPATIDLGRGIILELVWIPPGEFDMGSQGRRKDEQPVHHVKIMRGFWMGQYEVTQEQYELMMTYNPSHDQNPRFPVTHVNWHDAMNFCRNLEERLKSRGKEESSLRVRLPTESEWEYACRAGTTTVFYTGDAELELQRAAVYCRNHGPLRTHEVGQKEPNAWGLYDVLGNVWEWCRDWYDSAAYSHSLVEDPPGPTRGTERVLRGGCWADDPFTCRCARRENKVPEYCARYVGFRVVICQEP
jgi:formylglycine-generating enzyme required for sulfatase activity